MPITPVARRPAPALVAAAWLLALSGCCCFQTSTGYERALYVPIPGCVERSPHQDLATGLNEGGRTALLQWMDQQSRGRSAEPLEKFFESEFKAIFDELGRREPIRASDLLPTGRIGKTFKTYVPSAVSLEGVDSRISFKRHPKDVLILLTPKAGGRFFAFAFYRISPAAQARPTLAEDAPYVALVVYSGTWIIDEK